MHQWSLICALWSIFHKAMIFGEITVAATVTSCTGRVEFMCALLATALVADTEIVSEKTGGACLRANSCLSSCWATLAHDPTSTASLAVSWMWTRRVDGCSSQKLRAGLFCFDCSVATSVAVWRTFFVRLLLLALATTLNSAINRVSLQSESRPTSAHRIHRTLTVAHCSVPSDIKLVSHRRCARDHMNNWKCERSDVVSVLVSVRSVGCCLLQNGVRSL